MYIFEAALEYLISLLVSGSFLATLTNELGMSDSLTGILSSVISLGCLFQLLSVAINLSRAKTFVTVMSIVNQLLFMLLYVIPLSGGNKQIKIAVFIAVIFLAYLIYNLAHPKKINWLMSLVDDSRRGSFTANKEIFSLIAGMAFSFVMGAVIDRFKEQGNIRTALILSGAVIFVLTVLHTLTMVFTVEKPILLLPKASLKHTVFETVKNKNIYRVTVVFVIYYIANYASLPFYGTYQIHELGFSLKYVSVLTMISSVVRILVSKFWGRYADKKSFAVMIEKCFLILALAYICVILTVPANGKIMFVFYYIFHGIAMGGINSALINLVFDYVSPDKRADSLAICQAASGVAGFLSTLVFSPIITAIQQNGNSLFGIPLYAQQLVSVISLVLTAAAIVYVRKMFIKPNR